jgi:four helix bundle protein
MENSIANKSYSLALQAVKLGYKLQSVNKEFILSRQFIRSSTAIGALTREAQYAESKPDFIHKMSIALKEAKETEYWLSLLSDSGFLEREEAQKFNALLSENLKMLTAIVKSAKSTLKK